ncbi:MAG: hypothetical protein KKF46_00480 [Nanoarchaeota archaeon]|nr:hypothetical protein [Nanoarchaeota archaeon]MBU1320810.1 hypothetical protein [Nanoarchaeota archaeon]MBU1596819.1 hypothetical protein [Nanoarchaeota archaeon]MBU2440888.1 hypothetical protein [Nanoarchaeota archaeon]
MFGLIIAAIIAAINAFGDKASEVIFQNSTNFLFDWYVITTIIIGIIMIIITLVGVGVGTAAGGVLGFIGAGAVSLLGWIIFALKRGLFLSGAYFLTKGLVMTGAEPEWVIKNLILGSIILFIAVITRSKGSSSSSSSSN